MELLELIKQFSILLSIWVAIYAIDSWRREHVGKRQIELAEETLALFYEAADAIRHMRHPASFGYETDDVVRGERETDAQYEARKKASVVFHRYGQYQDLFSRLHALRYRFMAQIGKGEAEPFEVIRKITNEITASARYLSTLWSQDYFRTDKQREQHQGRVDRHEAVFWEGLEEDDPITPKLGKVILDIETTCRGIIGGRGTLHSFLNKKLWKRKDKNE